MKNVNVELGLIVVLNDVIYLLVKMLELNIILQIKPRVTSNYHIVFNTI